AILRAAMAGARAALLRRAAPAAFLVGSLAMARAETAFDAFAQLRGGQATAKFPQQIVTVEAYRARRNASTSVVPNYLEFPVVIPPHAVLRAGFTVLPTYFGADVIAHAEPVRFSITLVPAEGEPVALFERVVDVKTRPGDRRWHDVRLDLGAYAG